MLRPAGMHGAEKCLFWVAGEREKAVNTVPTHDIPPDIWERVRRDLAQHVLPEDFDTWFGDVTLLSHAGNTVRLGVPGVFRKNWIKRSYGSLLTDAFERILGRRVQVEIIAYDEKTVTPEADTGDFPPVSSYQSLNNRSPAF